MTSSNGHHNSNGNGHTPTAGDIARHLAIGKLTRTPLAKIPPNRHC